MRCRGSRLAGAVLVAIALAATVPGRAAGVQGFVSGRVLARWCQGTTRLDTEACLSYLRGIFDTLEALRLPRRAGGAVEICIPPEVAITQLRTEFARYAATRPERLPDQAAFLVLAALRERFPCED